jgi:hypothetical protein
MRSQSRAWPAGPEMTSYSAARMASIDWTSDARGPGGAAWAVAIDGQSIRLRNRETLRMGFRVMGIRT